MPRALSVFEVAGSIDGFGVELSSLTLTIVDGGLLLGRAACSAHDHDIALIDGKANLDLFESTDEHKVYSCRFSLVKLDGDEATIIDGAARVSKAHGLVGRWNGHGSLGRSGVCDHAFELKLVEAVETSVAKQDTGNDIHTVAIAAEGATTVSNGEARELLLRGDAVDQNGHVYTTTLQVTLHADGSVRGVSTELGRQCNLVGSWSGANVSYTLDFPINGALTQYSYRGVLATDADGRETLSGTWKHELQTAADDELFGGFAFTSLQNSAIDIDAFLPGDYVLTGSATSDDGTTYDSKLTLTLASDGSLMGKSEELSIAPQTCELQGSCDRAERMITYRMTYTNGGTESYEYVGKLHGQQYVGRWVNPRAADRVSERGNFVFSLTSFKSARTAGVATVESLQQREDCVSTKTAAAVEHTGNSTTDETPLLVTGKYFLTGSATSDGGTKYDSKLTLSLAADGSLTGESEELSIAPQVCKLEGSWNATERTISYNLIYTNGCTAIYEYVGRLDGSRLIGRWTNPRAKDCDAERGNFSFEITSHTTEIAGDSSSVDGAKVIQK